MPFLTDDIPAIIRRDGTYEITDDLCHEDPKTGIRRTVRRGFLTDLASVPRFLSWLTPIAGKHDRAAILHDRNCVERAAAYREGRAADISSTDTDGLFYRTLRELGVGSYLAHAYWVGVRYGAVANPARREGWWETFPKVALWTVALLPILPAALLTGGTLATAQLLEEVVHTVRWLATGWMPAASLETTLTRHDFAERRKP